jgi:hypothetical protein
VPVGGRQRDLPEPVPDQLDPGVAGALGQHAAAVADQPRLAESDQPLGGRAAAGRPRGGSDWLAAFEAETGERAALDEAETRVREVAPALLAKRIDVPVDLARSMAGRPPRTVLLAYRRFRREVIAWALTGDGTVETEGPIEARDLTGAVGQC